MNNYRNELVLKKDCKLNIGFKELVYKKLFCKNSKNYDYFEKLKRKLNEMVSIENILLKLNLVEIIKHIIFEDFQIKIINSLTKLNHIYINDEKNEEIKENDFKEAFVKVFEQNNNETNFINKKIQDLVKSFIS